MVDASNLLRSHDGVNLTGVGRHVDNPTTVVIVEDHVMMAEGLRTAVNQAADIDVVGLAASLRDAVELIGTLRPDVVVLDHSLPDGEAPDAIPLLRAAHPDVKVLVISGLADQRSVMQALEGGANGYLLKSEPVDMLTSGIRAIQRGDRALSSQVLTNLITCVAPPEGPTEPPKAATSGSLPS